MGNLFLSLAFVFKALTPLPTDGYTDSLGHYIWLEGVEEIYLSPAGRSWYRVAEDKDLWQEAMTIREANLEALELLGFDSLFSQESLFLYTQDNLLFTKLSHLSLPDSFIGGWKPAFNSDTWTRQARTSTKLKVGKRRTGLVLKFYPQKGGIPGAHALGLVKKGFFAHSFEAAMEMLERLWIKIKPGTHPHADPVYDMHLKNSRKLLKKVKAGKRIDS